MKEPYPKLCDDCKYSRAESEHSIFLLCVHPIVNASDPWALSVREGKYGRGSSCRYERDKNWSKKCGMKGKLWKKRDE